MDDQFQSWVFSESGFKLTLSMTEGLIVAGVIAEVEIEVEVEVDIDILWVRVGRENLGLEMRIVARWQRERVRNGEVDEGNRLREEYDCIEVCIEDLSALLRFALTKSYFSHFTIF